MKRVNQKASNTVRLSRPLLITAVMIVLIVLVSFWVIHYINHIEEEKCFNRLYEEAGDLADRIETYVRSDREELELLANVIAGYEDLESEKLRNLLSSYTAVGVMSRMELLLPDDTVLVSDGTKVDASGRISFAAEAAKGAHITDRETDLTNTDQYIVRHYVPVIREGETVAMLYGVVELGRLPEEANLNPYGGQGALYIIDGETGDFLVDTWHPGETGNMWALGDREMAPGYDPEQMRQGVYNGESRYVVFVSRTAGEYLYFYYEPMAINEWRIAVSVPESVVFASASAIERAMNIFLFVELICFILYFLWMVRYVRRVTGEKQHQLEMLNYIYDVEKLLFNAHERKENIWAALEKIGSILGAESVSFWVVGSQYEPASFLWKDGAFREGREELQEGHVAKVLAHFEKGQDTLEASHDRALEAVFTSKEREGIDNCIAVPVADMAGDICGILECCNITVKQTPVALLKNMEFSFSMFCRNLKIYTEIKKRGDRDALTGLLNRNRYERDILKLDAEERGALACVYIDVNGLHEMNNTQGHDRGDQMLRAVGDCIRTCFGMEQAYRIGGDEFIVFVAGETEAEVQRRSEAMEETLKAKGYYVSVGIQWEERFSVLADLVKAAEKKMYAAKERFYEQAPYEGRRARE